MLAGAMIGRMLQSQGVPHERVLAAVSTWLYNPFTFTISTRGSCDVLVVLMLLAVLMALNSGHMGWAAAVYGLAVHFRIYPIIYAPSIVFFLATKASAQEATTPARVPLPTAKVAAARATFVGNPAALSAAAAMPTVS